MSIAAIEKNEMAIMDHTGDTTVAWDPANTAEVEQARRTFTELRAKGYLAYRMVGLDRGEQMLTFDPTVRKIILAPAPVGG